MWDCALIARQKTINKYFCLMPRLNGPPDHPPMTPPLMNSERGVKQWGLDYKGKERPSSGEQKQTWAIKRGNMF